MELYARPVTIFDEQKVTDFSREHHNFLDKITAGDCSLILGKSYDDYDNFYDWLKEEQRLSQEENLKKGQVGCTTYLVLTKEEDELIALLDIRHSLNFKHGEVYGHIGIDIRPKKRNKGLYKEILKLAIELAKDYDIKEIVIACEYSNIPSKKGIEHIFGEAQETIPLDGTYYSVYKKDIRKKE